MADKDLKKLNRAELLEILVKQGRELESAGQRRHVLRRNLPGEKYQ